MSHVVEHGKAGHIGIGYTVNGTGEQTLHSVHKQTFEASSGLIVNVFTTTGRIQVLLRACSYFSCAVACVPYLRLLLGYASSHK